MTTLIFRFIVLTVLSAFLLASGANTPPWAQDGKRTSEIIRPKEMPLTFDKELGVPAVRIGQGKLHQVDVTLVEIPPRGKLAPHHIWRKK